MKRLIVSIALCAALLSARIVITQTKASAASSPQSSAAWVANPIGCPEAYSAVGFQLYYAGFRGYSSTLLTLNNFRAASIYIQQCDRDGHGVVYRYSNGALSSTPSFTDVRDFGIAQFPDGRTVILVVTSDGTLRAWGYGHSGATIATNVGFLRTMSLNGNLVHIEYVDRQWHLHSDFNWHAF